MATGRLPQVAFLADAASFAELGDEDAGTVNNGCSAETSWGPATVALNAGVDIKVVSEQLGHSTTTLTRDTYQSVVKTLHHDAADAVATLFRNAHTTR